MPNTKTVIIRPAGRHDRPPLLRALEYLLYAVIFVVLIVPPVYVYGLIIRDAANFRDYGDVRNFYDNPYFVYGVYHGDYSKIPAGTEFQYTIYGSYIFVEDYLMLENPAYTFSDGAHVALWQRKADYDSLVYVLDNGDFLLSVTEAQAVNNWYGSYGVLPAAAEKNILSFAKARLPFDAEQSLERIYARTKGRNPVRDYGGSESAGYHVDITYATADCFFAQFTNYDVDESGETYHLPEAYYIFDRATGEQVSIDRFCVGGSFEDIRLELTRRMFEPKLGKLLPPYEDIKLNEQELAEAAAALVPELINFGERGMFVELPAGCVSTRPDEGFYIAAYYFAVEDLIKVEGIVERVG